MKKRNALILITALFLLLSAVAGRFLLAPIFIAHMAIIDETHNYEGYSVQSFDDRYTLKTMRIDDESGAYATFVIVDNATENIAFTCADKYRTMDLKSIEWASGTYDVVVISGDTGTATYVYENETWADDTISSQRYR